MGIDVLSLYNVSLRGGGGGGGARIGIPTYHRRHGRIQGGEGPGARVTAPPPPHPPHTQHRLYKFRLYLVLML